MGNDEEMNFKDFFLIIKKRWKVIVLMTSIIVITVASLIWFVIPPVYESKISIIIGKDEKEQNEKMNYEDNYTDVVMYQNLIKTYSEIAKSDVVIEGAIKRLKKKISLKEMKKKIKITPLQDTQVIYIKVQGTNAKENYDIASAFLKSFIKESKQRMVLGSVQILDKPVLPKEPVKPNKMIVMIASSILGFLGSVGLAYLLEYLDDTIKKEEDILKYGGVPIIGTIPNYIEG